MSRSTDALQEVRRKREEILQLAARRGAGNIRIFGSTVGDGESAPRDVDMIVDLEPGRSLFDLGGLVMDLQDLLDRPVHVVTERSLHPYIRQRVLNEAEPL